MISSVLHKGTTSLGLQFHFNKLRLLARLSKRHRDIHGAFSFPKIRA